MNFDRAGGGEKTLHLAQKNKNKIESKNMRVFIFFEIDAFPFSEFVFEIPI